MSPAIILANASGAESNPLTTESITGCRSACSTKRSSRAKSSREPMVQPCTRMSWKNSRVSSAPGWSPVVAPQMAMVPPGRTDRTE